MSYTFIVFVMCLFVLFCQIGVFTPWIGCILIPSRLHWQGQPDLCVQYMICISKLPLENKRKELCDFNRTLCKSTTYVELLPVSINVFCSPFGKQRASSDSVFFFCLGIFLSNSSEINFKYFEQKLFNFYAYERSLYLTFNPPFAKITYDYGPTNLLIARSWPFKQWPK